MASPLSERNVASYEEEDNIHTYTIHTLKTARILASPLSERNVESSLSPISSSYAYALSTSSSRCASSAYVLFTNYIRVFTYYYYEYAYIIHAYQLVQVRLVCLRIVYELYIRVFTYYIRVFTYYISVFTYCYHECAYIIGVICVLYARTRCVSALPNAQ